MKTRETKPGGRSEKLNPRETKPRNFTKRKTRETKPRGRSEKLNLDEDQRNYTQRKTRETIPR